MSKKRIPFATVGWVNAQSSGDMPFSSAIIMNKEEQERLERLLKEPPKVDAVAVVSGEDIMRATLTKRNMPKVAIDPKALEKQNDLPTIMQIKAAMIEHRKTRLEDNHPVMEFLEDIIYCPSQIEFYFRDGEQVYCLYIRQRHCDTTAQLVTCYGSGDFIYEGLWPDIELSRD